MATYWRGALLSLASLVATLVGLELALQLMPPLSQSFDQWVGLCEQVQLLTPLNHSPTIGPFPQRLEPKEKYGEFTGWEYEERYDERGIKDSRLRPQDSDGPRTLSMGD